MKKKLNFGCERDIRAGYDNVDLCKIEGVYKSFNFNIFPYPLKDNTYDYVYSRSVLEHLETPDKSLVELWRVCRPNAIIEIIVPYYNNKASVSEMEHKHFFSDSTFEIFVGQDQIRLGKKRFEIDYMYLVPTNIGKFIPRIIREKLSLFLGGLISHVHVNLRIIK